jgi:hypothetical protein
MTGVTIHQETSHQIMKISAEPIMLAFASPIQNLPKISRTTATTVQTPLESADYEPVSAGIGA